MKPATLLFCIAWVAAGSAMAQTRLLIRNAQDGLNNRLEVMALDGGKTLATLPLQCERAHLGADMLACLHMQPGQGLKLELADRKGNVRQTLSFPNISLASRVRVARDGSLIGLTGFSAGHSYSSADFSTRTYLVDGRQRRLLADVSSFRVIESAQLKLPARRFNVWGVSFDPNAAQKFVVTVGAGNGVWLAAGDLQNKTLTLLKADVECPSFSPDGSRIAFKRRNPAGGWWPAVYELASGREVVMQDSPNVDDQIEWLDSQTLVYEMAKREGSSESDLMLRKADGRTAATVLRSLAGSPAVWN